MKQEQLRLLSEATRRVDEAERSLASAIASLDAVGSRADKVTISSAVRDALGQLSEARASLCALEASESSPPKSD